VISIVIPSIGSAGEARGAQRVFVVEAVRSVLATVRTPIEVVVVAGREMPASVASDLQALDPAGRVRCIAYDAPFNFSATVNLGAAHAAGEYVLLLNDDTEVIAPDWLERMLDAAQGPRVGAVGARLLFDDGTLQHAGHTYRTSLDHVGFGLPADAPGRGGLLTQRRSVAGATAGGDRLGEGWFHWDPRMGYDQTSARAGHASWTIIQPSPDRGRPRRLSQRPPPVLASPG
jgi:glycosyltransferase involved in cell wall biosynthesis